MKTSSSTSYNTEPKDYYFALPDNVDAFYAYINLIINNHHNKFVAEPDRCPKHFGPVKAFSHTRNEVGEGFIVVYNKKDYDFLTRCLHQFALLRTYWQDVEELVAYDYATRYDRAKPESRRQRGRRMYQK